MRDGGDEILDPRHRVLVVRIGLVPLEHRELGVVLVRDALVAEVLRELVDALESADDQTLEVQLGRDPEVDVGVELLVVRHERRREAAAVPRLENRRLDLDEAALVEIAADRRHHPRTGDGVATRVLVHQEVEVSLPVPGLDVGEAVVGVRQRPLVLRERHELVHRERRLSPARAQRAPDGADDVAEIDVERLAEIVGPAEQLNPARPVDQVEERHLPHVAARHHPSRDPADTRRLVPGLEQLGVGEDGGHVLPRRKSLGQHGRRV